MCDIPRKKTNGTVKLVYPKAAKDLDQEAVDKEEDRVEHEGVGSAKEGLISI
ncbi:MAG TPA: hypothetical protein VGO47_08195 [Chlamydiales bacterium]|nr:hypothetical protein [Chlamydiales bacterium]